MRTFTRRDLWVLFPAAAALLARRGRALCPFREDANVEPAGYDVAKALLRNREHSNELYRHLLGFGDASPTKGALLGWHGQAWPDPVLAGTPAGELQAKAGQAGQKQWDHFQAATGVVAGKVVNRWLRRLQGVAYLAGPGLPTCPPPALHAILEHRNMEIHPCLLPVLVGSTVDMINRDDCRDNIMSDSATARFSHWFTGSDQLQLQGFPKVGVVPLLCIVHPDEWGTILVVPTPFFALTGSAGEFQLPRVPPGSWTLHFWHPKLRPAQVEVEVKAGQTVSPVLKNLKSL